MENLTIEKFTKSSWLLAEKDSLQIFGGTMPSQCETNCSATDNGDGTFDYCCDDVESD